MKNAQHEGERWMKQAEYDLQSAEQIYRDGLWWIACFQAQQAAEKAVKAFLYSTGERLVLGHSVQDLLREAAAKNPEFSNLIDSGVQLDRYYIPTRYPNGLPGGIPAESYTKEDAGQALKLAKQIVEFVRGAI